MAIELDICNSAMIKLGVTPIQDLDEDTKEAKLCRMQYPKIRDAVLRSAPWGFATKRKTLTPIDPNPLEFQGRNESVFQLPVDCVKVWRIYDQPRTYYKIEGRFLIADDSSVDLYYVSSGVPVAFYDPNFMEAVANALASDLCYSLTGSATLKQSLEQTAEFWLTQARSYNSQEGTPDNFQFDDFIFSRVGADAIYP